MNNLENLITETRQYLSTLQNSNEVLDNAKNTIKSCIQAANLTKQEFSINDLYASTASNVENEELALKQIGIYAIAYKELFN